MVTGCNKQFPDVIILQSLHSLNTFTTTILALECVHRLKAYEIPEAGRTARGTAIINLIQLMPEEKITAIIPLREYEEGKYLFMATEKGLVKKTPIQDYANVRKTGLAAIVLREDDKLIEVKITDNTEDIFLVTKYGTYAKAINIEARAMIDIASKHIIPAVIKYITSLANSINQVREACGDVGVSVQEELLKESSELLAQTRKALKDLIVVTDEACQMQEGPAQAEFFKDRVVTGMQALREPVDALEMIVNKEMLPMPSYGDLLFEV